MHLHTLISTLLDKMLDKTEAIPPEVVLPLLLNGRELFELRYSYKNQSNQIHYITKIRLEKYNTVQTSFIRELHKTDIISKKRVRRVKFPLQEYIWKRFALSFYEKSFITYHLNLTEDLYNKYSSIVNNK